ncbi:MAG: CsbD family protein [Xanthobacteraceae bacterium]
MDENRLEGTARNLGGKIQEGVGRVTGDTKTQAEGVANEVRGKAQDLYGQAADTARDTATSWTLGCAKRSKPSLTRQRSLPWELAGCWAECTVLSSRTAGA